MQYILLKLAGEAEEIKGAKTRNMQFESHTKS